MMWFKALSQPGPATVNWSLPKCQIRTDVEEDRRQILALTEQEFARPSLESSVIEHHVQDSAVD